MKYTIHGFSQDIAVKLNLNSDDLFLLLSINIIIGGDF